MADKNSFIMFVDYKEKFKKLSDEQMGKLIRAVFEYEDSGVEPDMDDIIVSMAFDVIKVDLDKNHAKYEEIVEKRKEAGRKGGKCKQVQAKEASARFAKQTQANQAVNDNDNVSVNDNVTPIVGVNKGDARGKRTRFSPPTPEDIREYCREKKITVDADRFIDYYSAQGWKLSNGNPMKDWKAAVRNWSREKRPVARSGTTNRFNDFEQRNYDYNAMERALTMKGGA